MNEHHCESPSLQSHEHEPAMSLLSDEQLVFQISSGCEGSLREVIRRYGAKVDAVCRLICRDELDANSTTSEVFWELWQRATSYDTRRGELKSYLMMLARSRSIDRQRAQRSRKEHSLLAVDAGNFRLLSQLSPEEPVSQAERAQSVHQALNQLPEAQRQVIHLAFFEGCTHIRIAADLHLPLGTVKTRIRNGLMELRCLLSKLHTQEDSA